MKRLTYGDLQDAVQRATEGDDLPRALDLMQVKDAVKRAGGRRVAYLDEIFPPDAVAALAREVSADVA